MIDFDTDFGQKVLQRLQDEEIIWLTTVDSHNRPQPRPVWFHWDGETLLIFSKSQAAKVRHILRSPIVALHFNTDEYGGDVAVLHGEANISAPPTEERYQAYELKYRILIHDLGGIFKQLLLDYPVVILVRPTSMRGFI
jgi:PPOX class probable F420-dependent enzyme